MKNLNLSIPNPCTENQDNFTSTTNGGFCHSCSTEVIDFTKMSDEEILNYFSGNSNQMCGKFHSSQLKIDTTKPQLAISPSLKLFKAGLMLLAIGLVGLPATAHTLVENQQIELAGALGKQSETLMDHNVDHIIKGIIKSEEGELMPGVNIYLKNGNEGTVSDSDGKFEFPRKLKTGDVLVFSFIGFEKVEYIVSDTPKEFIEITMVFDTSIILGKVAVDEVYGEEPHGIQKFWLRIKGVF